MQSNYNFSNGTVTPVINVTLCGVPTPNVTWRFHDGGAVAAIPKEFNGYKYNYSLVLPRLGQDTCGRELLLSVAGYNKINRTVKVFLDSCKY